MVFGLTSVLAVSTNCYAEVGVYYNKEIADIAANLQDVNGAKRSCVGFKVKFVTREDPIAWFYLDGTRDGYREMVALLYAAKIAERKVDVFEAEDPDRKRTMDKCAHGGDSSAVREIHVH